MIFELTPLPYSTEALRPYLSADTVKRHYEGHHRKCMESLKQRAAGTRFESMQLFDIVDQASGPLFNDAVQVWNHDFYWRSMTPHGGGEPRGALRTAMIARFESFDAFRKALRLQVSQDVGAGWLWLVVDKHGLQMTTTMNADLPLKHNAVPLLVCDLREHAYDLEYSNRREAYVDVFFDKLVNWSFALANLETARAKAAHAADTPRPLQPRLSGGWSKLVRDNAALGALVALLAHNAH